MNISLNQTLANAIWPQGAHGTLVRNAILAIIGSLALWLSARAQVPFYPVPMTLQTLVVLGLGAAYGWRLAVATLVLYLAQGAIGLPVFAGTPEKGIGLAYMVGPTGGYLVGFIVAAALVGWFAERGADKNIFKMFLAMLAGSAVIYVLGVSWLAVFIGAAKAVKFGVMPFLYGDLLKAAIAAGLFPAIWALLGKSRA